MKMVLLCANCWPVWWLLTVTVLVLDPCDGSGGSCPGPCTCKWKGGKQTVECTNRGLITIPDGVAAVTQVLDLSSNNLQILPRETFLRAGLANLQRVYLKNCRIGQIDDVAFRGLTNLIELDLSDNLLTSVPTGTFKDVPLLRDLVLSNNPIQKIDSHSFKDIPGLVKLDLSNCQIQMIAPKAFEGIEMLESLKINSNRLSELRLRTVETLARLHGVELHDNPWHCDCRLRAVKEWLISKNIPYPVDPVCSGGPERVMQKTFTELQIDDFACKPEMLPVSRYVEALAEENATIVCRANAVPAAHISWYWNGRLLVNNSAFSSHQRIHILEEGHNEKRSSLVLTNAQVTDSSEFYCVAENRAGNAEANFTLHVTVGTLGMVAFGNSQIAGLSAALVILILFILLVIFVLLVRLRRMPFSESKTPGQMEVVTVVNGAGIPNGKSAVSPVTPSSNELPAITERKHPTDLNFCNPVQKPPRVNEMPYGNSNYNGNSSMISGSCFVSPSSGSGNNPDLINDTKVLENGEGEETAPTVNPEFYNAGEGSSERPGSGEYSRNADSLYPSSLWESGETSEPYTRLHSTPNPVFHYDDTTPIIRKSSAEELRSHGHVNVYPADYGLPIVESKSESAPAHQVNLPANAKTLRVWQKGAVPVLPPVTALKRVLSHNRSSPDEGYQEGCGTDV